MEIGRFKARIESDTWEADIANTGKHDLLFENIRIENDKIKGDLKMQDGFDGAQATPKYFSISKRGESFIIKTDFFVSTPEEMEIKFVQQNLLVFDKKSNVEFHIFNKESYN